MTLLPYPRILPTCHTILTLLILLRRPLRRMSLALQRNKNTFRQQKASPVVIRMLIHPEQAI